MPKILRTISEVRDFTSLYNLVNRRIGFVPTMGALHDGHLELGRIARRECDCLIYSIFVNPIQFGPKEDFGSYPRDIKNDLEKLDSIGTDAVFIPEEGIMYPKGFSTYIDVGNISNILCGKSRPGHFRGVATVVSKLLHIVGCDQAYFGKKDYQQFLVIKQMVKDLNFDIEIVGAPIVREKDGLAMSSRNSYLNPEQRIHALSLYRSLKRAGEILQAGETISSRIIDQATALIKTYPDTEIDYIKICDPENLYDMEIIDRPALMALAVKVGKTRLIDNMILTAQGDRL